MSGVNIKLKPGTTGGQVGTASLVAVGSGTAMASVCAIGLFEIQNLVGGVWSVLAVTVAGLLCLYLARVFVRLSDVLPSGAGLITYVSRAFGRSAGVTVVVPYLLLMMFLVGFESLIVGGLLQRLAGLPAIAGATLFIITTWVICQSGLKIGYRVQTWAMLALFFSLVGLSILLLANSAREGQLVEHLWVEAPSTVAFGTAVGQALFLFLGFELLTSHVEVAKPRAVGRALPLSIGVLFIFYATISLGFSVLPPLDGTDTGAITIPQVAVAEQAGGTSMVIVVALVCVFASFTSFNGALLALSRFVYALAAQGMLPRGLATLDRRLIAGPALTALLICALLFMVVVYRFGLYKAAILSAAITAAFVYGVSVLARQRPPFGSASGFWHKTFAWTIAAALFALGIGVIFNAGEASKQLAVLLLSGYGLAALSAWRMTVKQSKRRAASRTLS